ncbi:MAG: hypothetical protein M3066_05725 [Actinomycetota bacterium]|nr:hypothetical protein [Actinomycetota bacterium]
MQRYGEPAGARASDSDRSDRAARWTLRFTAVALFVAVIAVVLRVSLQSLNTSPSSSRDQGGGAATAGPATVDDLGPQPGVDIADYSGNRRAALEAATGERVAVASLNAYSTEAQTRALAGTLPVVALLVAAPGSGPSAVVGSLGTWASAQSAKIRDERNEIEKLLPTVTDTAFKDFYTSEVDRLDKAAGALTPTAPVVFAVVVRGPAATLRALAARPEVRLVDVGDGAQTGAQATFRGLRPEEKATAGDPPLRPAG